MHKPARSKLQASSMPVPHQSRFRSRPFVDETQTKQGVGKCPRGRHGSFLAPVRGFGDGVAHDPTSLIVQPKLSLVSAGDAYEQEADRVAAQVVARFSGNANEPPQSVPKIQRLSTNVGTTQAPPDVEAGIRQARSVGLPLPSRIRDPMERAFGADFSGVRIHTDAQSHRLNRSILSRAFVAGPHIYFERGAFDQNGQAGRHLLAHELVHVLQQGEAASTSNTLLGGAKHYADGIDAKAPGLVQLSRHDDIKKRAEQLWREKGGTLLAPGSEEEIGIWLQAEKDVDIAKQAEEIWRRRGGPSLGRGSPAEVLIWLEAEKLYEAAILKNDNGDRSPETKELGKKRKSKRGDKKVVPSVDPNNSNNNNPSPSLGSLGGSTIPASTTPLTVPAAVAAPTQLNLKDDYSYPPGKYGKEGTITIEQFNAWMADPNTRVHATLQYDQPGGYGAKLEITQEHQLPKFAQPTTYWRRTWVHFHFNKMKELTDDNAAHFKMSPMAGQSQGWPIKPRSLAQRLLAFLVGKGLSKSKATSLKQQ